MAHGHAWQVKDDGVPGCDTQFFSGRSAVDFGMPCSRLTRRVEAFGLCAIACLMVSTDSCDVDGRPLLLLVTNTSSSLELVEQTSYSCSYWGLYMVMLAKPFLDLGKGQSIESPTNYPDSLFSAQHLSDYLTKSDKSYRFLRNG